MFVGDVVNNATEVKSTIPDEDQGIFERRWNIVQLGDESGRGMKKMRVERSWRTR